MVCVLFRYMCVCRCLLCENGQEIKMITNVENGDRKRSENYSVYNCQNAQIQTVFIYLFTTVSIEYLMCKLCAMAKSLVLSKIS